MISGAVRAQCPMRTVLNSLNKEEKKKKKDAVMALHRQFVVFKHTEQDSSFLLCF